MENNTNITKVDTAKLPLWKLKQQAEKESIVRAIGKLVTKAILDGGSTTTVGDTGYIALRIYEEIEKTRGDRGRYYRSLSGEDLTECFNNGALGRYGENYGYATATFMKWIDRYQDEWIDKKRREAAAAEEAKRIEASKQIEMNPTMTREQAIESCKKRINEQYALFISEGPSKTTTEPKSIGSALSVQDWGGVLRRTIESEKGIQIKDIRSYFAECRKKGLKKIF